MTPAEAIDRSESILKTLGQPLRETLDLSNFGEYYHYVNDAAKELDYKQRHNRPWLTDWAYAWSSLYGDFEREVEADPMILYRPMHQVSVDFHSSPAFIRYFRAGNRTSKTQSGYAEHYFTLTGTHRWRDVPAGDTFIIGLAYSKYAPNIFEKKLFEGETDNPLSPMFPVGGKWFYHYHSRDKVLTIACPECAHAGKGSSCKHEKRKLSLFSDDGGWEVLQGAQYRLGHFDEHINEGFFQEAKQRLAAVRHSSLIITGTPLFGLEAWETRKLARIAEGAPEDNRRYPSKKGDLTPYISIHQIDQFSAGIVPHDVINMSMQDMDEFEIEARIYGKPAPLAKNPVFDRKRLAAMRKRCTEPTYVQLHGTRVLEEVSASDQICATEEVPSRKEPFSGWRVWKEPTPKGSYVAAVDSAKGLARGDASCCSIIQVYEEDFKIRSEIVAQYHGRLNTLDYADEVFKGAVLYNDALVVIELTGGYGEAVMLRLKNQLCYWNLYRTQPTHSRMEVTPEERFGVETNQRTKPFMVACLQQMIKDRTIEIPCEDTIQEMVAFTQETETKDGRKLVSPKYMGAGGAHDDRVMSLCIAAGAIISNPELVLIDIPKPARKPDTTYDDDTVETFDPFDVVNL